MHVTVPCPICGEPVNRDALADACAPPMRDPLEHMYRLFRRSNYLEKSASAAARGVVARRLRDDPRPNQRPK